MLALRLQQQLFSAVGDDVSVLLYSCFVYIATVYSM